MTPVEGREWCRLLGIKSADDLQRIMIAAMPWLALRARQLGAGPSTLPRGVSLCYALFIEAAGRDGETLAAVRRALYFLTDESTFWQRVDEVREAQRLSPLGATVGVRT